MKATVMRPVEVEITYVKVQAAVRYEDEDIPYDFPGRSGDLWEVLVHIDSGQIVDWPEMKAEVYMKVTDCGTYTLLDAELNEIASIEDDYVPHGVVPGDYGDYIDFKIASNGTITNWPKRPDVSKFFPHNDD